MFRRRIHTAWLVAYASVGFIIGVALVKVIDQTFFAPLPWAILGVVLITFVCWKRRLYLIPLLIGAAGLLGLWRGSIERVQLVPYEQLLGTVVTLSGKVSEDTDTSKGGMMTLRLNDIAVDGHELGGKLWVAVSTKADIKRGDRVTVKGVLDAGFGNFAAAMFRSELVSAQRPQPGDVARQVRDWFADAVRLAIDEPQASLGIGYLVGQKRGLPEDLGQALQIAGLTHIVVASGYNLTILVRFARRAFEKVSKYLSALCAGSMVAAFVAITGASPSMTRAGLVAGLSLLAWYYGRKFHPLVLLPFAAAVTVVIDPSFMWGDLGWQLSFAAFAGVMIVAPLLQAYFYGKEKPGTVRQILGETISAQLVTLPILVLAFGLFSNVAIIANLLVLPLVPLAMLLTFVAGVGALLAPGFASYIGQPAEWLLGYMTATAEYLSKLPWAQSELTIEPWHAVLAYAVIIAGCVYMWRVTRFNLREASVVE